LTLRRPLNTAIRLPLQHPIGLEEVADGIWSIYFCRVLLGRIDERDYIIRA
jgi:hypothetical protein